MATYKEKRGTNVVPIVSAVPETGVNGEIVYITGEGLASYNGGTWSKLTAVAPVTHPILGDSYGVLAGGYNANSGSTVIQRYSHVSDGNSADTGADLTVAKNNGGSAQTLSKGYSVGGQTGSTLGNEVTSIDVYTFANSSTNATQMGVTTPTVSGNIAKSYGSSGYSGTHFYYHGYRTGTYNNGYPAGGNKRNVKTSFASTSGSMTYVGTLTGFSFYGTGGQSDTHGYADGGRTWAGATSSFPNNISRYAFSSDGNSAAYSAVAAAHQIYGAGFADTREKHYLVAGYGLTRHISNFTHASGGSATSTNNLCDARGFPSCTVSSTHIFLASGASFFSDNNEKIAIASDTTAASAVGSIVVQSSNTSQDYGMYQFQH